MRLNVRVSLTLVVVGVVTGMGTRAANAQKWQTLATQPLNSTGGTAVIEGCHLLTDGTVMCLESGTNRWHRLSPDITGSYLNGTWDAPGLVIPPMPNGTDLRMEAFNTATNVGVACNPCGYAPRFFASAVLPSGKVVVIGGEDVAGQTVVGSLGKQGQVQTNIGFIYDPQLNTWSAQLNEANAPLGFGSGNIGDAVSAVRQDGTFILANISSGDFETLDPATLKFARVNSTGKVDNNDEEGWTLLPNNKFLTVDAQVQSIFELYDADPTKNSWTHPGTANPFTTPNMPVNIADVGGASLGTEEVGPGVLRPDGKLVYFSGTYTGQNALYDSTAGTWSHSAAMDFPFDVALNAQFSVADGPAVPLPNGNVLVMASPVTNVACGMNGNPPPPPLCGVFNNPSRLYEVDFATNTLSLVDQQPVNGPSVNSFEGRMLLLPTGEVLFTTQDRATAQIYTNGGTPQDAWRPVITVAPAQIAPGSTVTVAGNLFNGFSQGAVYGDDAQMSTNYPVIRITNNATGHVVYGHTHDHSRMGVEALGSTEVISTKLDVPATVELGASTLTVVVNGIPSAASAVVVATNHPPVAHCQNVTVPADNACQAAVTPANIDNGSTDPDGDVLSFALTPTGPFTKGTTAVTLTVTDTSGATNSCNATVTVVDTTPPVLTVPPNVTVASCSDSQSVQVGQATATDNCASALVPTGQVISLNGVPLVPPINVTGGQAVLKIGTSVIHWTVSDGTNTTSHDQTVIVGTSMQASNSFLVDDRGHIVNSTGGFAAVLNSGTGPTRIGNDGRTAAIISRGPVTVTHRAIVNGNIVSASTVTHDSDATINGTITMSGTVVLPALPTLPAFPTPTLGGFTVNSGVTSSRPPGSYTSAVVLNGGTLILSAGDYFFQGLTINSGSTIRVTPTTRVFVRDNLVFNASFRATTGTAVQPIFLGLAASISLTLAAEFDGTLVAPNAALSFGSGTVLTFTGSFFARTLEVTPATSLVCKSN